jgi:RNA polymerase sigma factor (sigma-70 family)
MSALDRSDPRWFQRLVEEHTPRMIAAARPYAKGPIGADDIVQSAWIKVINHQAELLDVKNLGAWLEKVVKNTARDMVRPAHVLREVQGRQDEGDRMGATGQTPPFEIQEEQACVWSA